MLNKNALISAILMASSTAQLSANEINAVQNEAVKAIPSAQTVYLSKEIFGYEGDQFRMRLTLKEAEAGSYTFTDGLGGPDIDVALDYELIVEYISLRTGEIRNDGMTRFAKNLGNGRLKAYFCDSTSVCSEEKGYSYVKVKGDVLTIADGSDLSINAYYGPQVQGKLVFEKIEQSKNIGP